MKKGFLSAAMSLLCSNFAFGMGVQAMVTAVPTATTLATAVVAAGLVAVVATPTPTQAGTLNPPELIYEDGKVKVEKVWENEFPGVDRVVWGKAEVSAEESKNFSNATIVDEKLLNGKVRVVFPKVFVSGKTVIFLGIDGSVKKKTDGVMFYGEDFKDVFALGKWLPLPAKQAKVKEAVPPQELSIVNDEGTELWKSPPRVYGIIRPVTKDILIDFESFPGGGDHFTIYNREGKVKTNAFYPSDGTIGIPDFKISNDGKYIIGFVGDHNLETAMWDILGNELWKMTLPYYGYLKTSEFYVSPNGDYTLAYLVKSIKFKRDGRNNQMFILVNNSSREIIKYDLSNLGTFLPCFSSRSEYAILFINSASLNIYMKNKNIVAAIGRDRFAIDDWDDWRKTAGCYSDDLKNIFVMASDEKRQSLVKVFRIKVTD